MNSVHLFQDNDNKWVFKSDLWELYTIVSSVMAILRIRIVDDVNVQWTLTVSYCSVVDDGNVEWTLTLSYSVSFCYLIGATEKTNTVADLMKHSLHWMCTNTSKISSSLLSRSPEYKRRYISTLSIYMWEDMFKSLSIHTCVTHFCLSISLFVCLSLY